jgi:hypothetical protein
MPKTKFPEFSGKDERGIMQYLQRVCNDDSYHSNYMVDYMIFTPSNSQYAKLGLRDAMEMLRINNNLHEVSLSDACFGYLPGMIRRFLRQTDGVRPEMIAVKFNLTPFDDGAGWDEYDYYDGDDYDYDPEVMEDLTRHEIRLYCAWLMKHDLVPDFDVELFIQKETAYFPAQYWKNINALYFSLTMLRYMHEGQNIARRILAFDEKYDCDPFVNIALAHWLADYKYNNGHCVCDIEYIRGYDDGTTTAQLKIAKIARAMRVYLQKGEDDIDEYRWEPGHQSQPYYQWENSCVNTEQGLKMVHPKTWRGVLRFQA